MIFSEDVPGFHPPFQKYFTRRVRFPEGMPFKDRLLLAATRPIHDSLEEHEWDSEGRCQCGLERIDNDDSSNYRAPPGEVAQ